MEDAKNTAKNMGATKNTKDAKNIEDAKNTEEMEETGENKKEARNIETTENAAKNMKETRAKEKFGDRFGVKLTAFILCVALTVCTAYSFTLFMTSYMDHANGSPNLGFQIWDVFTEGSFDETESFARQAQNNFDQVAITGFQYRSEEYAKSGKPSAPEFDAQAENIYALVQRALAILPEEEVVAGVSYGVAGGESLAEAMNGENPAAALDTAQTPESGGEDFVDDANDENTVNPAAAPDAAQASDSGGEAVGVGDEPPARALARDFGCYYYQVDILGGGKSATIGFDLNLAAKNDRLVASTEGGRIFLRDFREYGVRDAFLETWPEEFGELKRLLAENTLNSFEGAQRALDELGESGVLYYTRVGADVMTNIDADVIANIDAQAGASSVAAGGAANGSAAGGNGSDVKGSGFAAWIDGRDGRIESTSESLRSVGSANEWVLAELANAYSAGEAEGARVLLAYTNAYFEAADRQLGALRDELRALALFLAATGAAAVCLLVLLLVWTGRKRRDGSRRLYVWDRFLMEAQIFLLFPCAYFFVMAVDGYASNLSYASNSWPEGTLGMALFLAAITCCVGAGFWMLASIVRNIKARVFVRHSAVGLAAYWAGRGAAALFSTLKTGFDGRNPLAKTVLLVGLFWALTGLFSGGLAISLGTYYSIASPFFGFLAAGTLVLALVFAARWARRYERLRKGVDEVSGGNVDYRIEVPQGSRAEFDVLSRCVNEISSAIEAAVANEMKNQRLKTDLISNVSHDLKTPLTSIITYTDLLKKEGLDSPNAAEYLKVLEEKGQRLRKLTDDLFEAAKASSGSIPVRVERVDLLSLVLQEIAETEEGFAASGLEVVVNTAGSTARNAAGNMANTADAAGNMAGSAAGEHYFVCADGNLMWRVLDNLFNNVRKYALSNSRVYIDFKPCGNGDVVLEVKNVSAAKLNIPVDELMERFTRGDENRATEGSGLGLAIARDLVRLQHGSFDIVIDGDLFKAVIGLKGFFCGS